METAVPRTASQKFLNFAARVVSGRQRLDYISDVRDALGWLDSSKLSHLQSISLPHKIIQTGEPECLSSQLCTYRDNPNHNRSTRQDHFFQLPMIRTEAGRRRFLYRAPRMFNELPEGIRALKGAQFRRHLKSYLLDLG